MSLEAAQATEIEISALTELRQFDQCVDLQVAVWGYSDGDVIPRRVFLVAQRIGGQVLGAIYKGNIVGFAMGLPGHRNGSSYLHSHMLAVLPEFRNAGLGRRLKLAQRDDALRRGFHLMEWTFDPLEIRNAHLNLERLGAVSRRYHVDFYGPSSSPLQGGLPTDRLYAEWWLSSERVDQAMRGELPRPHVAERVTVPQAIYRWKNDPAERGRALALQAEVRSRLQDAFAAGLVAIGYQRDDEGNGIFLLGPWQPPGAPADFPGPRTP